MLCIFQSSVHNIKSSIFDGGQFKNKLKAHTLIFDKSRIFIDLPLKKIITKSTGSKSKDSISLKISPLDFLTFKMYILTPNLIA